MWVTPGERPVAIENETFLPEQYFANARAVQPEKRFLLAILVDAWNDLEKNAGVNSKRAQRLVAEAWEWMEVGDLGTVTFDYVCEHLGKKPEWIRKGVLAALEGRGIAAGVRRSSCRASIKVRV